MHNKAVFLDRDGVINIDKSFVHKIKDLEFVPGIVDVLRYLQEKGYLLIIITNQSGIARGYYKIRDFYNLTNYMTNKLKESGINITATFFCPHYPKGKIKEFSFECNCRKPKPGMVISAISIFNINPKNSWLVGDKDSDILLGKALGIKTIRLKSIYEFNVNPDYLVHDVKEIINIIN